jgi:hypothetical protein
MMGELPQQQNALFYDFCLEKHIPEQCSGQMIPDTLLRVFS